MSRTASAIRGRDTPTTRMQSEGSPSTERMAALGSHLQNKAPWSRGESNSTHLQFFKINVGIKILK